MVQSWVVSSSNVLWNSSASSRDPTEFPTEQGSFTWTVHGELENASAVPMVSCTRSTHVTTSNTNFYVEHSKIWVAQELPSVHQQWASKWTTTTMMDGSAETEHDTTMLVRAGTGYYPNASHTYWWPTWNYNCCKHGQVNSYCSYGLIGFLTGAFTVQCAWFGDWVSIEADGDVQ